MEGVFAYFRIDYLNNYWNHPCPKKKLKNNNNNNWTSQRGWKNGVIKEEFF